MNFDTSKFNKLIKKAGVAEKQGALYTALKCYKQTLPVLYAMASRYADTKVGLASSKEESFEEWDMRHQNIRNAIVEYFQKNKSLFVVFEKMGIFYSKTGRLQKAERLFERVRLLDYHWSVK